MTIVDLFLNDYTLRIVSIGAMLLGLVSGVIGSFAVLRRQGLLGDAVSHASLPGIAIAFIILGTKSTVVFMLGALLAGLIASALITLIDRYTRIHIDSAMAFVLSVFFGFGLVLLTYIQKIPNANQAGLEKFIFGQASTLLRSDVVIITLVGSGLLIIVALLWKELKLIAFDSEFADSIGFSSNHLANLLSSMIVLTIIIGLQTVGVILMSAMLVAPAVAARQWTNKLSVMVLLSGFFGMISGLIGTVLSSLYTKLPTGPMIVIIISFIVIISITLAPNRGLIWRYLSKRASRKNISDDAVLANIYHLAMNHQDAYHSHPLEMIEPVKFKNKRDQKYLEEALTSLAQRGLVKQEYFNRWALTEAGYHYIKKHPLIEEVS